MKVSIGQMSDKIVLQRATELQLASGELDKTWSNARTVYAKRKPTKAEVKYEGDENRAIKEADYLIYYQPDLNTEFWRIKDGDTVYKIDGIEEYREDEGLNQKRFLLIYAKTVVNAAVISNYDPLFSAYLDKLREKNYNLPSINARVVLNNFVKTAKSNGWLQLMDLFYFLNTDGDLNGNLVNLMNPSAHEGSNRSGVTFEPQIGITGNGVDGYIDLDFITNTDGVNFTDQGGSVFCQIVQPATDNPMQFFGNDFNTRAVQGGGDVIQSAVVPFNFNDPGKILLLNTDTIDAKQYHGLVEVAQAPAENILDDDKVFLLNEAESGSRGTNATIAAFGLGGYLNDTLREAMVNDVNQLCADMAAL